MSSLSNRNANNTRFVTLVSFSSASSSRVQSVLKSVIKGILLPKLIWWLISLIPPIRLFASECYTLLTTSISLDGEIMSPYSYYAKKGLVYIIIADFFSRQSSSYTKYTKSNTCALYNVRLISLNKCVFLYYTRCCTY